MDEPIRAGARVAYFGGSFDPPHLGHLAVARAAREALRLDAVLFAPVGTQPLKIQGSTASFDDRVAMTRLAIAGERGMSLSLADAPTATGTPNYSIDTLTRLREELPARCTLFFLMGADSFVSLRRWHRAAEIPFVAPLIVASRPGQRLDDLRAALPEGVTMAPADCAGKNSAGIEVRCYSIANASGARAPFYLLPDLDVEISASEIRAQFRAGALAPQEPKLLPDPVAEFVRARGMYREAGNRD
ncbi:MAG TPA: nicotinate (nicotinamide) nucleotide adenylyltransferase [Terracidiphilus sp.]|nr:nicotinate (nicotinamide) nucleotide adenylyltransferase [Terracidiphilus sp.]